MILTRLVLLATLLANCTGCIISGGRSDFYGESKQINKYFVVDRKNVDYLTPATVLSLRQGMIVDVDNIGQYLNSMCTDYLWMNENRFIYIFGSSKYSSMFDSFGIKNIKKRKPVEKFIASYNPDEMSVTFYPLLDEKRKKVYLDKNWCRNGGS